ncbi:MAG: cation:proton antiporter [Planctomycetes bacterium]|nr:cation:proton antiporter [Planctomycetota bacterium]MCB9936540.1 cation:proton antiporter [Planctomycetota bacterium]
MPLAQIEPAEALTWLREQLFAPNGALVLAFLFIAALVVARLSTTFKYLPKVTAYLLVGLAAGPYAAGLISKDFLTQMEVVKQIGLALIVFLVGTDLTLKTLGSVSKSANRIALVEIGLTFVLVAGGVTGLALATGNDWRLGLVLGCFAVATAPAATLAVVREYNADGPVARHIKAAVARNDVVALLLFGVVSIFIFDTSAGKSFLTGNVAPALKWMLLPFPIGAAVGLLLAYLETVEEKSPLRMLLALGGLMVCIGAANALKCSEILMVLVAGFSYGNSTVKGAPLREQMRTLEIPFYVIFFVLSGAKLDVRALAELGMIGIGFLALRTVGKTLGPWLGARWAGMPRSQRRYMSFSLLSQSAIAIAIMTVMQKRGHALADEVTALVLGSVLVFEIIGPILVKVAVIRSGEVSIVDAVKHKERIASGNQFFAVIAEFLGHLGLRKQRKQKTLGDLVLKKTQALPMDASFEKITKFIETYPHDSFPIVDKDGFYVGFISYNEIKDAGFDPVMKDLVRAADLITSPVAVDLDEDDVDSAYLKLRDLPNTALPVVKHSDNGRRLLVGTITQRELIQAYMEAHEGRS